MSSEIYVVTDVSEPTGRFLSEELLRNGFSPLFFYTYPFSFQSILGQK